MTKPSLPPYFLLSFIPAAAYWILELYFTLEIALMGGMIIGVIEMAFEKKISGHVHTLSKLNVALILILGGVALVAQEGIWFKLQPTFTGVAVASFLAFQKWRNKSIMHQMLIDMRQPVPLPMELYKLIEWHLAVFLLGFAVFMGYVAVYQSTSRWIFWKTAGFYIVFGAFLFGEMIYLKWLLRRKVK